MKMTTWVYRTADGEHLAAMTFEFGLIAPPTIELHRPMVGPVTGYSESYFPAVGTQTEET